MYKVVRIEGKDIPMKSDGGTARLYRQYFKKDYLLEIGKIQRGEIDNIEIFDIVENLAWVMAKRANKRIPDIDKWLASFRYPDSIIKNANEIYQLVNLSLTTTVEPKKRKRCRGKSNLRTLAA